MIYGFLCFANVSVVRYVKVRARIPSTTNRSDALQSEPTRQTAKEKVKEARDIQAAFENVYLIQYGNGVTKKNSPIMPTIICRKFDF